MNCDDCCLSKKYCITCKKGVCKYCMTLCNICSGRSCKSCTIKSTFYYDNLLCISCYKEDIVPMMNTYKYGEIIDYDEEDLIYDNTSL